MGPQDVPPGETRSTVIESSSGNLGAGLAQACRYYGMHLICVVDARANDTNIRTMRALGADVHVVTRPDPETGELLVARLRLVADLLASTPASFWPMTADAAISRPSTTTAGSSASSAALPSGWRR
jgi:cysteine synthase